MYPRYHPNCLAACSQGTARKRDYALSLLPVGIRRSLLVKSFGPLLKGVISDPVRHRFTAPPALCSHKQDLLFPLIDFNNMTMKFILTSGIIPVKYLFIFDCFDYRHLLFAGTVFIDEFWLFQYNLCVRRHRLCKPDISPYH
jgi:hypothetical protein